MRDQPPSQLADLLGRLGLASESDLRAVAGRVRRLAGALPRFEFVWVDALAQARILTPFQAAQINAGRAESLAVGRYLLCQMLHSIGYGACYLAQHKESGRVVRATSVVCPPTERDERLEACRQLMDRSHGLASDQLAPIEDAFADASSIWVITRHEAVKTVAEWQLQVSRLAPHAVLEVARQMVALLIALDSRGIVHGDLVGSQVGISHQGLVVLFNPGLRGAVRPLEGFANANLPPETFDGLAPERAGGNVRPNAAADVYACGALWWQMLTGRGALSGATGIARLRSAQEARIPEVTRIVPDTPEVLASAIAMCLDRSIDRRPESFARLAVMLGSSTREGRFGLARSLKQTRLNRARLLHRWEGAPSSGHSGRYVLAAAAVALAIGATLWPIASRWYPNRPPVPVAHSTVKSVEPLAGPPKLLGNKVSNAEPLDNHNNAPTTESSATRIAQASGVSAPKPPRPVADNGILTLPCGKPLALSAIDLRRAHTVRGEHGQRPLIFVPYGGLTVAGEMVRFENVDFVWSPSQGLGDAETAAIMRTNAQRVELDGCSFQAASTYSVAPIGILWTGGTNTTGMTTLPTGELVIHNTVARRLRSLVALRRAGATVFDVRDTLLVGRGSFCELRRTPGPDEPLLMTLAHVTLRGSDALMLLPIDEASPRPGELTVQSADCAFQLADQGALFQFTGGSSPRTLTRAIRWLGQGSVINQAGQIVAWRGTASDAEDVELDLRQMAGLVRCDVGFAGNPDLSPAASEIQSWQVPRQSTDPPGVRVPTPRTDPWKVWRGNLTTGGL